MNEFVEWLLHTAPTLILVILAVVSLFSTKSWFLQGYTSSFAVSNLVAGFLSKSLRILGFIVGGF